MRKHSLQKVGYPSWFQGQHDWAHLASIPYWAFSALPSHKQVYVTCSRSLKFHSSGRLVSHPLCLYSSDGRLRGWKDGWLSPVQAATSGTAKDSKAGRKSPQSPKVLKDSTIGPPHLWGLSAGACVKVPGGVISSSPWQWSLQKRRTRGCNHFYVSVCESAGWCVM